MKNWGCVNIKFNGIYIFWTKNYSSIKKYMSKLFITTYC
jgi:hypothetical protein